MPEEHTLDDFQQEKKRPTFLTVLCILSFIAIGLTGIGNLISVVTFSAMDQELMEEGMDQMEDMMEGSEGGFMDMWMSSASAAMEHTVTLAIVSLIAQLICLFGVLQMWKMKKSGFYMYIVGELTPAIAAMVLIGGIMGAIGFFIPIVFIILYGLNVKHMS